MAELFVNQAAFYAQARPTYPAEWFAKLASLTEHHDLVWDVGTGNGQSAIGVAEHYGKVVATDVSDAQLRQAIPHPKVRYVHTPLSIPDEQLISIIGGENSVDLITVAQAVHWFDLPAFYSLASRLLRKPGGVIAIWCYNYDISPIEHFIKPFFETTVPYWDPRAWYALDGYRDLPFPFEGVGLGAEGDPVTLEIEQELSFDKLISMMKSWSAVATAKERGVDLLSERVVKEVEGEWGGKEVVRRVTYKAYMLAGKLKME